MIRFNDIKYIVSNISEKDTDHFIAETKLEAKIIQALDPRSAVYMATGISAQNQKPVIVLMNSSNASRSAFSGMTESFYRNIQIILITVGVNLDYSRKINDTIKNHYKIANLKDLVDLSIDDLPVHIEITNDFSTVSRKIRCARVLELLSEELGQNDYLYISQDIYADSYEVKCKVVRDEICGSYEGKIANVLGASLAKKRDNYCALISERELIHDLNTLGNINMNSRVSLIICCKDIERSALDYVRNSGFTVIATDHEQIDSNDIRSTLDGTKKTAIFIEKCEEN